MTAICDPVYKTVIGDIVRGGRTCWGLRCLAAIKLHKVMPVLPVVPCSGAKVPMMSLECS